MMTSNSNNINLHEIIASFTPEQQARANEVLNNKNIMDSIFYDVNDPFVIKYYFIPFITEFTEEKYNKTITNLEQLLALGFTNQARVSNRLSNNLYALTYVSLDMAFEIMSHDKLNAFIGDDLAELLYASVFLSQSEIPQILKLLDNNVFFEFFQQNVRSKTRKLKRFSELDSSGLEKLEKIMAIKGGNKFLSLSKYNHYYSANFIFTLSDEGFEKLFNILQNNDFIDLIRESTIIGESNYLEGSFEFLEEKIYSLLPLTKKAEVHDYIGQGNIFKNLEFYANLSPNKLKLALDIVKEPGAKAYIGDYDWLTQLNFLLNYDKLDSALKILAIPDFSSFIQQNNNILEFLVDLSDKQSKLALEIIKKPEVKAYINDWNRVSQLEFLLNYEKLSNALKTLAIPEFVRFIRCTLSSCSEGEDQSNLEFLANLPEDKFDLAVKIIKKSGVVAYIGDRNRVSQLEFLLNYDKLDKALKALAIPEFTSFIKQDSKELEFLINLPEAKFNLAVEIIKKPGVEGYIGDWNRVSQLEFLLNDDKLDNGLKALATPELTSFIKQDSKELEFLVNLPEDKFNLAVEIIKKPGVDEYIGYWNRVSQLEFLLNYDKLDKALKTLATPEFTSFIKQDSKELEFLVNLPEAKFNLAVEIIKKPGVEGYIGDWNRVSQLEFLLNYDKLDSALKALATPEFTYFIKQDSKELEFLVNLPEAKFNLAVEIIKKPGVDEYIGYWNRNRVSQLEFLLNYDKLDKALKALATPEFTSFINYNSKELEFLSNLTEDKFNQALEIINKLEVKAYIGDYDRSEKLNNLLSYSEGETKLVFKALKHPEVTEALKLFTASDLDKLLKSPKESFDKVILFLRNHYCVASSYKHSKALDDNLSAKETQTAEELVIGNADLTSYSNLFDYKSSDFNRLNDQTIKAIDSSLENNLCKPKSIDYKLTQIIKDVSNNPAFKLPVAISALATLEDSSNHVYFYEQSSVYYFDQNKTLHEAVGFYSSNSVVLSAEDRSAEDIKATLVHELEHQVMSILFKHDSNPYPLDHKNEQYIVDKFYGMLDIDICEPIAYNVAEENFDKLMIKTITNLHKYLLPNLATPKTIQNLLTNLKNNRDKLQENDQYIIDTFYGMLNEDAYDHTEYHKEFIVRLPQIIAKIGGLSPAVAKCFELVTDFYKNTATPKLLEYIKNHPHKNVLIVDDHYPESYLTNSSKDDLFANKNPNEIQLEQIKKINEISQFIKSDDKNSAYKAISALTDITIKEAVLGEAITEGRDFIALLTIFSIAEKEFLGPELVHAMKAARTEIVKEMLPLVQNKYYLSQAAEIAATQDSFDLAAKMIDAINDSWFSQRATKYLNEAKTAATELGVCLNFNFATSNATEINGVCENKAFNYAID